MDKINRKIAGQFIPAMMGALLFFAVLAMLKGFIPVVYGMSAKTIDRTASSALLRVAGHKIRSCTLAKESFVSWFMNSKGQWQESSKPLAFPKDASPGNSRPVGWIKPQDFGLFLIGGISSNTRQVRVTVTHKCDSNLKVSVLGPWSVSAFQAGR